MSEEPGPCSLCSSPGVQLCSKCKIAIYCSRTCQIQHWSTHKPICKTLRLSRPPSPPSPSPPTPSSPSHPPPSLTSKIYILHPSSPFSTMESKESLAAYIESWDSEEVEGFVGKEKEEKKAVAERFGVLEGEGGVREGGKGYGKGGSCLWYYYAYTLIPSPTNTSSSTNSAPNPLASALFNQPAHGPVVVVKSGPDGGQWEKDASLELEELVDSIWWYGKESASHPQIWDDRELQRTLNGQTGRGMTFSPGFTF